MLSLDDTQKDDELTMSTMKSLHRNHCMEPVTDEVGVSYKEETPDGDIEIKTRKKRKRVGWERKANYIPLREFIRKFDAPDECFEGKARRIRAKGASDEDQ